MVSSKESSYFKNMRLKENISKEERSTLLKTVPLDNGRVGDVVTCFKKHTKWCYICHVCNVSITDWAKFAPHINGNRHRENMKKPQHLGDKFLIQEGRSVGKVLPTDQIKPLMGAEIRPQRNWDERDSSRASRRNSSGMFDPKNDHRAQHITPFDHGRRPISPPKYQPFHENVPNRPPISTFRLDDEERRFYDYIRTSKDINVWHYYTERIQLFEENLLQDLKFYKEMPERHPKYEEEQIKYWQERNQELIAMGEDPRNYDIKVEWRAYWDIRLHELFREIFENSKIQLRNLLQSIQNRTSRGNESQPQLGGFNRTEPPIREQPLKDADDISVIPVLRKLSVLEHNLGSLGPKIVDLLSKALALDKFSENGANTILESEEHCILLETAKEKLKGFMQSGLLPEALIEVTKNSIMNISELLERSESLRQQAKSRSGARKSLDRDMTSRDLRSRIDDLERRDGRSRSNNLGLASRDRRSRSRSRGFSYKDGTSNARDTKLPSTRARSRSRNRDPPTRNARSRSRNRGLDTRPRRSRSMDRSNFHDNNFTFRDERLPNNEPQYRNNTSFQDEKQFANREAIFQSDVYPPANRNPQNVTSSLKVSEIAVYIDKLPILSHLSYMQRSGMAQQIASLLLLRGVLQVTEAELLLLIKTILSKDQSGPLSSGNIPYSTMNAILPTGQLGSFGSSTSNRPNQGSAYPPPLVSYPLNRSTNRGRY